MHMHKKFQVNRTKIKGGCQSGRKVVRHDSKSDLPLSRGIVAGVLKKDLERRFHGIHRGCPKIKFPSPKLSH